MISNAIENKTVPVCGTELRVLEADYQSDPRWLQFLESHPDASIYHHPGWLNALESEYGRKCVALACVDSEGSFQGVLPLLSTRGLPLGLSPGLGARLSSLPRTPLAGPLCHGAPALRALLQTAIQRTQASPGVQLQLKMRTPGIESQVEGMSCQPWRTSYVYSFPPCPAGNPSSTSDPTLGQELRFGNSRRHLRIKCSVNKAGKLGVRVRAAETVDSLQAWYDLYLDNMRENAVPPRPYRFFDRLWKNLQPLDLMRLWVAEQDSGFGRKIIAGVIVLMYGRQAFYAFGACPREARALHPNDLLHWHAMNDAWRRGYTSYDFGEVPGDHEQLARYKEKWGSAAVQLYRYDYPERVDSVWGLPLHLLGKHCKSSVAQTSSENNRRYRRLDIQLLVRTPDETLTGLGCDGRRTGRWP